MTLDLRNGLHITLMLAYNYMYQKIYLGANMTKRYVFSYEDLQNLIHESITFFSDKSREYIKKSRDIRFSDRTRWIEEFLSKAIVEYPLDEILDKVEEAASSFLGRSLDDIKEDLRRKQPEYAERKKEAEDHFKLLNGDK